MVHQPLNIILWPLIGHNSLLIKSYVLVHYKSPVYWQCVRICTLVLHRRAKCKKLVLILRFSMHSPTALTVHESICFSYRGS